MPLVPGTLLNNRYRIVSILGQGGMGAVYRAHDEHLNIPVAVKENLYLTQEYGRQFQSEARILAGLRHTNLPHVTDYFALENNIQYLVMDYIEGEDLRQRMERMGALPEREAILIGISICDALAYLHSRRPAIVHRDIKPGNIKVTPDGQAVLVDFGLAKIMEGSQVTSTGARAMTPGYSPPEQYGTARTDPRSDVYSLGATLYASLSGIIPEDGLGRMTGRSKLTPVRDLVPKANRKLADTIERALDIDPNHRFQSAEEFAKALIESGELNNFYQERPAISPPPNQNNIDASAILNDNEEDEIVDSNSRERSLRRVRKPRPITWALIPTIFSLIAASIYGVTVFRPDLTEPLLSYFVLPQTTSSVQATQIAASFTTLALTATSPQLPTQTPALPPQSTVTPVFIRATFTATSEPTQTLEPTPTETPAPTATPLGGGSGQIAFASDRGGNMQIWLMSADGKQAPRQISNAAGGACQPAWSPDGMRMAYTSPCESKQDVYQGSNIFMIEIGTPNKPARLTSGLEGDYDPAWSSDGKHIAYTSVNNNRTSIYVLNLNDLSSVNLSNSTSYMDKQPAWSSSGLQIAFVRQLLTSQIWTMTDSGQFQSKFTVSGAVNNLWPAWTNDDQAIYYSQMSLDAPVPFLMIQRYEDRGSSQEVRIPGNARVNGGPFASVRQSTDGQWFVYESWPESNHDIFLMNANASNPIRLTTDHGYDFSPAWRPIAHQP